MGARPALLSFLLLASVEAGAEATLPMPATGLYVDECGSCHTAYAPGYLPAASWQRLMDGLSNHFGEDARLKAETRETLARQLRALAMDGANAVPGIAARNGAGWAAAAPERITTSPFFQYMHEEIPSSFWRRPKIGKKSNCGACHPNADMGRYSEAEIYIPK